MAQNREYIENAYLRVSGDLGDTRSTRQGIRGTDTNTLRFQCTPPELGTSKAASYTPVQILGRANPLWIYGYSDERAWSLELKFFVVDFANNTTPGQSDEALTVALHESAREQVVDKVNWCEALVYPIYKNGLSQGPPTVQFVFGNYINVNCICTDVQTSVPGPWTVSSRSEVGWPMQGIVNLTLKQIGGASLSYKDVRDNLHNSPRTS